jgi:hypothetical protein
VISDSTIHDLKDLKDLNLSSLTRLRLFPGPDYDSDDTDPVLFPDGEKLDKDVLGRYFQRNQGAISSIEINFGKELPVEWDPQSGILNTIAEDFILQFKDVNELKYGVRVRLAYQHPHQINVKGEIIRENAKVKFSFAENPTVSTPMPLNLVISGMLPEEEFEYWRKFDTPEWRCPECGEANLHLLHLPMASAEEKPVFKSLSHLSGGYVLLCTGSRKWNFFQNGCRVDGTSFVLIDGKLHWSQARGRVEEVSCENEYYCLRTGSHNYYICRIT